MAHRALVSHLISVDEALERILAAVRCLPAEPVELLSALGRILAADVQANADIPPFDNSAMDGYAVVAADTAPGVVELEVLGSVAAGETGIGLQVRPGSAIRIMTGAPLPAGADAVVRFEETDVQRGSGGIGTSAAQSRPGTRVRISSAVKPGDNVRHRGEDVASGRVVLKAGSIVRPQEIGLLAGLGQALVSVHRKPRVAILATGDELVAIDEPLTPGKIRNVNEYATAALVLRSGGEPLRLGIARDTLADLKAKVSAGLAAKPDLFLTSAGVSVGDFDMVKDVLASEGHMEFWAVAMKPGKPMAFGQVGGVPLIGLPGNPVAAMVSFEQFVRPAILKMSGRRDWRKPTVRAVAQETISNSGRRNFVRAVVKRTDSEYTVSTTGEQGSGVLTSLVRANGLLVIPEGVDVVHAGEYVEVQMLDWSEDHF